MGGNLEFLDRRHLLLTMGDLQFDGWYHDRNLVQDRKADYGKTLTIDLETGTAEIMTMGHRNPQGLVVDSSGRAWSTEHGPQGGDELNLLRDGDNYGYPYHTYGTEYGSVIWPATNRDALSRIDEHLPEYAWVPSIGISDLIQIDDPGFSRWRGDLLVSSLVGRAIWRVHLRGDGRVAYAEPIKIGTRIRDIAADGQGDILLWTDHYTLIRLTPAERADEGSAIFAVRCGGCHDDHRHRIGPHLNHLFDRGIATVSGYDFSQALQDVDGEWTAERLDRFLAAPQSFAPGTRMSISGIKDEHTRDRIIQYLRTLN
jgi:cytochrome c2